MDAMNVRVPLRELKKERTKRALEAAALRLFRERGYAETSVAAIAAEAEVSRRTFFRYFRSKEGVVFANAAENAHRLQEAIESEPDGADPLRVFGNAVVRLTALDMDEQMKEETLARQRLFLDNLELRSRLSEVARLWRPYLAEALAARAGRREPDESDLLYSAVGITVIQTVLDQWTEADGSDDLAQRFRDAFDRICG
jgi:AcrR family transcriptional regulator